REVDAESIETHFFYDGAGNLIQQINAAGTGDAFVIDYDYDDRNREKERVVNGLAIYLTEYFDDGTVEKVTDPRGNETTFTYDELKRVITETNGAGEIHASLHDGDGRL